MIDRLFLARRAMARVAARAAKGTKVTNIRYPSPGLSALADGCRMDMRVKLAIMLLQSPTFFLPQECAAGMHAKERARFALEISEELYSGAEERGWIEPLPTDNLISEEELSHVRRNSAAQVHGQLAAQQEAQKLSSRVVPVAGSLARN